MSYGPRRQFLLLTLIAALTAAVPVRALTIDATMDTSITSNQNSAAIQTTINHVIGIAESLFSDPTTVSIEFRFAVTEADGVTPLSATTLGLSEYCIYESSYTTYVNSLKSDAKTANDAIAIAHLP